MTGYRGRPNAKRRNLSWTRFPSPATAGRTGSVRRGKCPYCERLSLDLRLLSGGIKVLGCNECRSLFSVPGMVPIRHGRGPSGKHPSTL